MIIFTPGINPNKGNFLLYPFRAATNRKKGFIFVYRFKSQVMSSKHNQLTHLGTVACPFLFLSMVGISS